jgi:7-cyano-7-deazaguanine synthase
MQAGPKSGNALVLISGGIDSFACGHFLITQSYSVSGLFVDYGQVANAVESTAATVVAASLRISLEKASFVSKHTYGAGEIPGRNGLLAFAALAASSPGTSVIATGIHSGTPYYDCTATFVDRLDILLREYTAGMMRYLAPFLEWSKADIIEYCNQQRLDLSHTYSCEAGTVPPCGTCASCGDRLLLNACR